MPGFSETGSGLISHYPETCHRAHNQKFDSVCILRMRSIAVALALKIKNDPQRKD